MSTLALRRGSLDVFAIAVVAAAYIAAAKLGLTLAFVNASATAVWPPAGIALAALLLRGPRLWPAVFIGAFVANITTAGSAATSLGIAAGNTLEALLGMYLVTRFASGRDAFSRGQDVIKFFFLAALASTTVSATIGVASLELGGFATWNHASTIWLTWWLGDAAGDLLVAPFLILWSRRSRAHWSPRKLVEGGLLLLSLVVIGLVVFGGLLGGRRGYPIDFIAVPPLVWAAFRFSQRETATTSVILASMALWGTLHGYGPFAWEDPNESLILLQAFTGLSSVLALAFAALVAEKERVDEERMALIPKAEAARRLAESSEQRASFLAEMSAILGSSLDYDTTLSRVVRLSVPILADLCAVDLLQDNGTTRRVAQTHVNPAKETLVRDVRAHHGFNPEAPSGVPAVLRSRQPVLVPQATETDLENASRNAAQLAMFRTLDLRSWMIVPLIARGHILGAMTFVVTESDRRYGPDDLALAEAVAQRAAITIDNARLYQDALGARADAEAANRLKDEFLAMLGHELRNPLGAISNAVHILDRVEDARGRSALQAREIIARQVGHLSGLVDDLLDVGRVMTGKIQLERSPLDLHEAAGRALRTLRAAGKAGGHMVTLHGEPVWIDGDVARIEQIVLNLVENGLRYTPAGGAIRLEVLRQGTRAVLRAQDTGMGIDATLLPRIFDLFVQGDRALDRGRGGLGIGLTLVKRLVELHAGTVEAASDGPGTGSVFTVTLPALSVPSPPAPAETAAPAMPSRRVAIIEDNPDSREALRVLLELYGHEVYEAADGPTGVELVLRLRPDVTLIDVGLPGLDGYGVAQRLRASAGGHALYLIAVTGYGLPADQARARQAGFDSHLVKPVHPGQMIAVLRDLRPST